jgi:hypothetical protein
MPRAQGHVAETGRDRDRLVRDGPDLFREPVHLHREAHRRVHGSNAAPLEGGDDPPRDVVHLIAGVMELEVREGAGRVAHVLSVHPTDEAEERPHLG